ncbi:SufS family cysteine desulfurase [Dactylosporangium sp. CA-139114]|uniref:SufS family cysteine desulfurase n=1 Tax=Dactylosporangium sp. CA-139114 TaxID=3239931 RepID=UPI003D97A388
MTYYFVPDEAYCAPATAPFDVGRIRADFPILRQRVHGHALAWLDNAATTQKPQTVIDRVARFSAQDNSNIHRGAHTLASRATEAYEDARATVARFLGAATSDEVVFVRGATEAINLVAHSFGGRFVRPQDEIIVSHLEHHANLVPWQRFANGRRARLRVVPVGEDGQIRLDALADLLGPRTRLVAIAHVSNALGTIVPVREVVAMAHRVGARVLVDGAQAVPHLRVDVRELDADFYVFSGHKVFGPTGVGALYGKAEILESMPPWQSGGNMIQDVSLDRTIYRAPPARFEAGTGPIAEAIGLATALDYVDAIGWDRITSYEHGLLEYATLRLGELPGLRLIGTAAAKAGVLSFTLEGTAPQKIAAALDRDGIAVRAGHHCAQPILRRFGVEETVRASLALYNTRQEIDLLAAGLRRVAARHARPTYRHHA